MFIEFVIGAAAGIIGKKTLEKHNEKLRFENKPSIEEMVAERLRAFVEGFKQGWRDAGPENERRNKP